MLLVLILLLLGILVFLYLIGVFADIQIKTDVPHPLKNKYVAYRFYKNEYKSAGKGVDDIKKIIKNDSFIFGIYYDDPEIIPEGKQRYVIATALSRENGYLEKQLADNGYKFIWLPDIDNAVVTEFPINNFVPKMLTLLIAILRVYPKLKNFINKHNLCAHPFIECYLHKSIKFIVPLSQQDKYYVDECKTCEVNDNFYEKNSKKHN